MRKILILLVLLGAVLGGGIQAQDENVPPVYIYLEMDWMSGSDDVEDIVVPESLQIFLIDVIAALEAAGQNPILVAENPENFGESLQGLIVPVTINDELYDEIFEMPPYRAVSLFMRGYGDSFSLFIGSFVPFPLETLPMGNINYTSYLSTSEGELPDYAMDLVLGTAWYVAGGCENAATHFESVRQTDDFGTTGFLLYSAPRFYEANCRYMLGEIDTAVTLLEEIIAWQLEHIDENRGFDALVITDAPAINLATIYIEQDKFEKALTLLDQRQDIEIGSYTERYFARFFARADLYLALDRPDKMIGELDAVLDLLMAEDDFQATSLAWLYTERGYRYELIDDTASALADYERAIEIDPEYPVAYYRRGLLSESDQQQQDFEQFLALAPDFDLFFHPSLDAMIADVESRLN